MDSILREQRADELEEVIQHLDTLYDDNQDCILPEDCPDWILKQWKLDKYEPVPDGVYDTMRDGTSSKPGLKQLRSDSYVFAQVRASTRKSAVKKVKHIPPLASLHKSNHELYNVKRAKFIKWLNAATTAIVQTRKSQNDRIRLIDVPELKMTDEERKICKKDALPLSGAYVESEFEIELKYDGILVALYYERGILIRAGLCDNSGLEGEDITENVKYVANVPQKLNLPVTCRITGEMICKKSDFEKVQAELKKKGEKVRANPRNHAGGALRRFDNPKETANGRLYFIGHGIANLKNPPYTTGLERAKWANQQLGIRFSRVSTFTFEKLAELEALVPELDYEVDGAVVSVADLAICEEMGQYGDRATGEPRGREAWKFKEQESQVKIDIVWQTGRSGVITPVATFPPVKLAGTMVNRATLHNFGHMIRLKIDSGSVVKILKSGKIIPKVVGVVKPCSGDPSYPKKCPSCGGNTILKHTSEDIYAVVCPHSDICPAQNINRYTHFLKAMGIKGLGTKSIEALTKAIKEYADFFTLDVATLEQCGFSRRESLLALGGIHMISKPESMEDAELLTAIKHASKAKSVPLAKFLAALGMPGAGKTTGVDLASHFVTLDAVIEASELQLAEVDGVGDKTASSIKKFFIENRDAIKRLAKHLVPEVPKVGKLSGMAFCFSGSLPEGKDYWIAEVEKRGGSVKGSVSKKLNFLVVGSDPGDKVAKATSLGIKQISLDELKKML